MTQDIVLFLTRRIPEKILVPKLQSVCFIKLTGHNCTVKVHVHLKIFGRFSKQISLKFRYIKKKRGKNAGFSLDCLRKKERSQLDF